MSLYACVDSLNNCLNELEKRKPEDKWYIKHTEFVTRHEQWLAEKKFITELRDSIEKRSKFEDYQNLDQEINCINDYIKDNPNSELSYYLRPISNDLQKIITTIIEGELGAMPSSNALVPEALFPNIPTNPFYYIELGQMSEPRLGLSRGECGGYVMALAEKLTDDEPDLTQLTAFKFNKVIHDYQKNLLDRNKDQGKIKSVRLTRVHFCADYRQQATEILATATQHRGKGLELIRYSEAPAHACYLRMSSSDSSIIYMDPNAGLFKFQNQEDFISIYSYLSQRDVQQGGKNYRFNRYELRELRVERPSQSLSESISWAGKVRTLLTGHKYNGFGYEFVKFASKAFNFVVGGAIGAWIAVIVTAASPVLASAVVGSVVFPIPILGTVVGALLGLYLSVMAYNSRHQGILAVPHYLQDRWHDFKDWVASFKSKDQVAVYTQSQEYRTGNPTDGVAQETTTTQVVSSTTVMLEHFNESPVEQSAELDLVHDAAQPEVSISITSNQSIAVNNAEKEEDVSSLYYQHSNSP